MCIPQLRVRSVIWITGNTPQAQTHGQFPLAVVSLARGLILRYESDDGLSSRGTLTARALERWGWRRGWEEARQSWPFPRCRHKDAVAPDNQEELVQITHRRSGNITVEHSENWTRAAKQGCESWAPGESEQIILYCLFSCTFARLKIKELIDGKESLWANPPSHQDFWGRWHNVERCWGVDYQPQSDGGLPKPSGSQLISAD